MRNTVKEFVIAGFSTGGGLALLQAANKGRRFKGVVSVSAPLKLHNIASKLATAVVAWNTLLDRVSINKGKKEFIPNRPENPHINYFRNPVHGVSELEKLMNIVEQRLPDIHIPTLLIQASDDPVVNPVSVQEIYDLIGTREKEIYKIYSTRHGIMRGDEAEKVAARILTFCHEVFSK